MALGLKKGKTKMNENPSKENGEGKENHSPTPPIREIQEGKESTHTGHTARTRETQGQIRKVKPVADPAALTRYPTIEEAKEWAKFHSGIYKGRMDLIEEWWESLDNDSWCNAVGDPIRNWRGHMRVWFQNYALFEAKRDPKNVETKGSRNFRRHADNYLAPVKEDNGNVLPF